jgi:hypothetical protein
VVSLTKGTEVAGDVEIIHIYTGMTSALVWAFTDGDFAAPEVVSDTDLTSKFAKPATGQTAVTSFTAGQYDGAIAWNPADGTFAASTIYTATVTLTAKPGSTFNGVAQDAFDYNGATSVNNDANGNVVTIVFPQTGLLLGNGMAGVTHSFDDGVIAVTADPQDMKITKGGTSLDLTVPTGYTVTGWYINGANVSALGANTSVSLDPDDYDTRTHRVTVLATKGNRPYSWQSTFTVEAGGGGGGSLSLADFNAAKIQELIPTQNDATTPVTLVLDSSFDLSESTTLEAMRSAIISAGRYIALDLSACTVNNNTLVGVMNSNASSQYFNYLVQTHENIVGIILPSTLTSLGTGALLGGKGLMWVSIPDSVISVGNQAFANNNKINRYILGPNLDEGPTFRNGTSSWVAVYDLYFSIPDPADRAGVYVYESGAASKEP